MSRAVVIEGPHRVTFRSGGRPVPGAGEAVVRVAFAGICGSDVDLEDGRRPPPFVRYPIVPGHEWSGTVELVGAGVPADLVGQPVVGENIRPCGHCEPCRRGNAPACESGYEETGFTLDGAWADHVVVAAALLHVLPADADLRSAAGIEPAACAAAAILRAEVVAGDRVAVIGGGTIGLLCAQLARAAGAEITVVDPQVGKEDLARRCGAGAFVAPATAERELHDHFDVVIEAAGVVGSAALALAVARRGARVVICGIPPANDTIGTLALVAKGLHVSSVFGAPHNAWCAAVCAFVAGSLDPGVLVTHELELEDAKRALEMVAGGGPGVGKVLLRP
ncbi:MAG: alcohol dehydrogenase catalytic domain-containing protein [Acidimicrobiales bacterium]